MIAYNCKYTPKELLEVFDECVLINNTPKHFENSDRIMHPNICSHIKAVVEDVEANNYDRIFLMNCCTSVTRLADVLKNSLSVNLPENNILGKASLNTPFVKTMDLPVDTDRCAIERLTDDLLLLVSELEDYYEKKFDIKKFISLFDDLQKSFPNEPFVYLMGARSNASLISAIEKSVALPVSDITCINNRGVIVDDFKEDDSLEEIMKKYASALLCQMPCMRMSDIHSRRMFLENENCAGIIYHTIKFCDYYDFEYSSLLKEEIPILKIETDFSLQAEGQLATRLEGFSESLKKKRVINMNNNDGKFFAGIDSGSTSTELVIIDENKNIIESVMVKTGANALSGAKKAFDEAKMPLSDIRTIIATGYGRKNIDIATGDVTEITCHAKGAVHLYPDVNMIIDIGGQDSKVIYLDEKKNVKNFVMNDKCAAGTGRFLENMAKTLEMDMEEFVAAGLEYKDDITISNMCTVFAESEVVSLIAKNRPVTDIIHGLNKSVATKTKSLAHNSMCAGGIMMTGGVANNKGVVKELEKQLDTKIFVPGIPEFCGALGAALIALENSGQ